MANDAAVEPALPWAIRNDIPNVPVGARIEVKWCLTIEAVDSDAQQAEAIPDDVGTYDAAAATDSKAGPKEDATVKLDPKAAAGAGTVQTDGTGAGQNTELEAAAEKNETDQPQAELEDAMGQKHDPEPKPEAEAQPEQPGEEEKDTAAPGTTEQILWWGATVTAYEEVEGRKLAVLKYDAKEGFPEETRHVEFAGKGLLMDADEMMKWRLEGEESPESESDDGEDELDGGSGVVFVEQDGQLLGQGDMADVIGATLNTSLDRLVNRFQPQIESMTPFEQSFMLQGWSEFCEAIKQKVVSKGPDGVLEEEDVWEVSRELKRQRGR